MKHRIRTILLSGLIAASSAPVAARDASTAYAPVRSWVDPAELGQWIPFSASDEGPILVPILLDGQHITALLDTGAPMLTIDRSWAESRHLDVHPFADVHNLAGGIVAMGVAPLGAFAFGGVGQTGGSVQVGELAAIGHAAGHDFQAVVGGDILTRFAVEIDFDRKRLRLRPSGSPPPAGMRVPLRIRAEGNRMLVAVRFGATILDPAMIDTGDTGSLAITKRAWARMPHADARLTDVAASTFGDSNYLRDYLRADDVGLGNARIDKVPTNIETYGADPEDKDDARIGLTLLRRFNLFIDAGRGMMVLTARATPPAPAAITTSGVQWVARDDALFVVHAMKNSPAAIAGLRDGDRICAVNGARVAADWAGSPKSSWGRGPPGTPVALTLCEGRRIGFVLREFY